MHTVGWAYLPVSQRQQEQQDPTQNKTKQMSISADVILIKSDPEWKRGVGELQSGLLIQGVSRQAKAARLK